MRTRPLTPHRFAELEALTPLRGEVDEGYFDDYRTFTRWLPIGNVNPMPRSFERVAYDPEGLDGLFGDEHTVSRVHYAPESRCWRWQVHSIRGDRVGLSETETDKDAFPCLALSYACGHLDLAMAHERFLLGSISEEAREEPSVLPVAHPKGGSRLLPWTRYFPKTSRQSIERYYRCWALVKKARSSSQYLTRPGESRRAVQLVSTLQKGQGAMVICKPVRGTPTWIWSLSLTEGKVDLEGKARSRKDAFKRIETGLRKLGAVELYLDPTIIDLAGRLGVSLEETAWSM